MESFIQRPSNTAAPAAIEPDCPPALFNVRIGSEQNYGDGTPHTPELAIQTDQPNSLGPVVVRLATVGEDLVEDNLPNNSIDNQHSATSETDEVASATSVSINEPIATTGDATGEIIDLDSNPIWKSELDAITKKALEETHRDSLGDWLANSNLNTRPLITPPRIVRALAGVAVRAFRRATYAESRSKVSDILIQRTINGLESQPKIADMIILAKYGNQNPSRLEVNRKTRKAVARGVVAISSPANLEIIKKQSSFSDNQIDEMGKASTRKQDDEKPSGKRPRQVVAATLVIGLAAGSLAALSRSNESAEGAQATALAVVNVPEMPSPRPTIDQPETPTQTVESTTPTTASAPEVPATTPQTPSTITATPRPTTTKKPVVVAAPKPKPAPAPPVTAAPPKATQNGCLPGQIKPTAGQRPSDYGWKTDAAYAKDNKTGFVAGKCLNGPSS